MEICDAWKDLSAVGYTYSHFVDNTYERPIVVIGGRLPSLRHFEQRATQGWLPLRMLPHRAFAYHKEEGNLYAIEAGQTWRRVSAKSVPQSRSVDLASADETIAFPQKWWSYRYPDPVYLGPHPETWNRQLPSDRPYYCVWCQPVQGVQVGHLYYRQGPSDTADIHTMFYFPLIRRAGKTWPLRDSVSNRKGLDLFQVQFVSPEGWMVLNAEKQGKRGIAWLFPK